MSSHWLPALFGLARPLFPSHIVHQQAARFLLLPSGAHLYNNGFRRVTSSLGMPISTKLVRRHQDPPPTSVLLQSVGLFHVRRYISSSGSRYLIVRQRDLCPVPPTEEPRFFSGRTARTARCWGPCRALIKPRCPERKNRASSVERASEPSEKKRQKRCGDNAPPKATKERGSVSAQTCTAGNVA